MSQTIDLTCPKCGAPLEVHKELSELSCPYCGYKKALVESDAVKIERLRTEAYKEVALHRQDSRKKRKEPSDRSLRSIPKRTALIVLIAFAAILIIPLISELSYSARYSNYHKERAEKTFTWPRSGLSSLIPQPQSSNGELYLDGGETLSVYAANTTEDQFSQYIEDCKEAGFSIGINQYSSYYEAYDEAGNYLDVSFDDDNSEMHIRLEKAIETAAIEWPDNPLAQRLPVPDSLEGNISQDSNDVCLIYLSGMTKADFTRYARKCVQAGFSESYLQDNAFYGNDADGNTLSMDYLPSKLLKIRISAPYR